MGKTEVYKFQLNRSYPSQLEQLPPQWIPHCPEGVQVMATFTFMSTVQESHAIDKGGLDGSLQGYFQLEYSETSSGPEYHF